uniref:L1 transposable element RRM domain-containing protein n=1 Tax=Molossus molossus TaxID=27622 RepID=A0A7J8B799_MOLMO|nr:hypothetical protein HJG59_010734 [Molossus molossus]
MGIKVEAIYKKQEKIRKDIADKQNILAAFISRLEEAEDQISDLEDKVEKNTHKEQQMEKKFKKQEESLRELWDNTKCNNICIIGVPKREESKKGIEEMFEVIMSENSPKLVKENVTQVQETQRVPSEMNPRRLTARHTIIKMANIKHKERILKEARETQKVTYNGAPIRLSADFSIETLQARRELHKVYKAMQGYQSKLKEK